MKRFQLDAIKNQILGCLRTNPVETIFGLLFFALFIIAENSAIIEFKYWQALFPFMFPTLFVIAYSFNYFFKEKKRPFYYLSLLALLPLFIFTAELQNFLESPAYAFTLLLTAFLFFAHRKTADNVSFATHCIRLVLDLLFALIIGAVLLATVLAIYYTIVYIFNIKNNEQFIFYVSYFIGYLFVPLFFSQLQQQTAKWESLPKVVQFVLNFILSPAIIIYTAILYVYFITIVFNWELPKGGVANMVIAFIIIALGSRMLQLVVSQRYYEWFYRPFGFIAIPPLVLFWVGTIQRICTYSLTEYRVYLLAAGVLMTLYVFLLYSRRFGNYRLMLLLAAATIVLFTYIPGISARSIGIMAQSHRMEHFARELSLWDEASGKLVGTENFEAKDSVQLITAKQLKACYDYLVHGEESEKIIARYGENRLNIVVKELQTVFYNRPNGDIPIDGYKYYVPDCSMISGTSPDTLQVNQGEHLLLKIDVKQHFEQYRESMALWDETPDTIAPFCLQNDSFLVVINRIVKDEEGVYKLGYSNVLVFRK